MKYFLSVIITLFSLPLLADNSIPHDVVKYGAQLLNHKSSTYLVVNYEAAPKWHTYWKNPGDAGLPTTVEFKLNNKKIDLTPLEWPIPGRYFEQGNMLAYGYEKSYSFFYQIPPSQLVKIESSKLSISSKWLVCKHVCIPGSKVVTLKSGASAGELLIDREEAISRLEALPKETPLPNNLELVLAKDHVTKGLILFANFTTSNSEKLNKSFNLITPFPMDPFTFKHEVKYIDKKGNVYSKLPIEWDGEYMSPPVLLPEDGKFHRPYKLSFLFANPTTGKIQKIVKTFKSFSLDAGKRLNHFTKILTNVPHLSLKKESLVEEAAIPKAEASEVSKSKKKSSIWTYILFAFIGGLILNVMPCVLPVISIKLFGLISHSKESRSQIFKHNLFYTFGVLSTFALMAGIVTIVKLNGESIGWGFQLQSPHFIAITLIVLFIMALNLFGLFEFKTPGGSKLGGVQLGSGYSADFFGGILATILATPCSAPFLGTALTFAFTGSTFDIFATFMAIGLGLSAPFILTGIFPNLINWLPRPGMWMETVKKLLGLTLLLTMVWLLDVFSTQVEGTHSLTKLNISIVLVFFAIFAHQKITKKWLFRIPLYLIPIALIFNMLTSKMQSVAIAGESRMLTEKRLSGLQWEKWSEQAMLEHKSAGDLVFIDFTAKWCFTCKINEKAVIQTDAFKELINKEDVKLLLADWTKRDPIIGDWLKSKGYAGVPAYFVQKPDGSLIGLGEIISIKKIRDAIKK